MITLQPTLRTITDSCKNAAPQCNLVAMVIYIQSVHRYVCVCIYTHILHDMERDAGQANGTKTIGTAVSATCRRFGSPVK